jgi:hypothetical protein
VALSNIPSCLRKAANVVENILPPSLPPSLLSLSPFRFLLAVVA